MGVFVPMNGGIKRDRNTQSKAINDKKQTKFNKKVWKTKNGAINFKQKIVNKLFKK